MQAAGVQKTPAAALRVAVSEPIVHPLLASEEADTHFT
jgi:hypothetical protein